MKKFQIKKTAYVAYLYADGHAVIVHREKHDKAGDVEWAEIIQKVDIHCAFEGRIVFHEPKRDQRFALALSAYEVAASEPSTENGSENTRKHGMRIGSFTIRWKDSSELYWVRNPDMISDGLTYQPEVKEAFDPEWNESWSRWGSSRIAVIHRLPKPETAQVAA